MHTASTLMPARPDVLSGGKDAGSKRSADGSIRPVREGEEWITFRPIRPDDKDAIERMFSRMSTRSIYLRFASPIPRLSRKMLSWFTEVDGFDRYAVVAGNGDEIIGLASFDRDKHVTDRAEMAVMVEDAWQGRTFGRRLIAELGEAARERGIRSFTALVLRENRRVIEMAFRAKAVVIAMDGPQVELLVPLRGDGALARSA